MEASAWTPHKQNFLRDMFNPCFAIEVAVQRKYDPKHPWFYFDATPGPGLITQGNDLIKGSPIIALDVLRGVPKAKASCLFIERDPDCANQLAKNITLDQVQWSIEDKNRISVTVQCIDHSKVLLTNTHYGQFGLIYFDLLGKNPFPAYEANVWLNRNSQHDLLIMASGTAPKRAHRQLLDQMLLNLPRRYIFLSEPRTCWQWIFAVGTNYRRLAEQMSEYGITMYEAKSWRGQQILRLLGSVRRRSAGYKQQFLFDEGI